MAAAAQKHPHLSAEELAEFREIFNLVDLDKGGTISKDELKQLMHTLGLRPSQEELNAMVDEIDADGNGEIDFDEFVTVMSRKVNTSYTPAQVKAAFKVFEKDAPGGFVTMAALEQARVLPPVFSLMHTVSLRTTPLAAHPRGAA
jgi:calmodulin